MNAGLLLADTIAAIATARGRGAIGIVKISGPLAWEIAERIFVPKNTEGPSRHEFSHRLHYGWIHDPHSGERIDEVLLSWMRGPHTYTGEDVAEINAHGGERVLAEVLEAVLDSGARLAEPGEFTRRALINGRIDLSQAEAVADLICARSRRAMRLASRNLEGELGRRIEEIRQRVVELMARIDADIDFGDQIDSESDPLALSMEIREKLAPILQEWIEHYRQQRGYLEGVKVAAVGRPNVGKSSLINRLIKKERLIVTEVPGTTRDLVDIGITLGDLPMILTDTAGLHPSNDPVETLGIERTQNYLDECELILFILDAAEPFCQDDHRVCEMLRHRAVVVVFNKMDLLATPFPPMLPKSWPNWDRIGISARHDVSMEALEGFILRHLKSGETDADGEIVPNLRQSRLLTATLQNLLAASNRLAYEGAIEIAAIELAEALKQLEKVLGRGSSDDVLDEVFKRFCIGK